MLPLGETHDILARIVAILVLTGGLLVTTWLVVRRPRGAEAAPWFEGLASAAFSGVIAGALALALGGPGALAWLLIASLLGAALQRAEPFLIGDRPGLWALSQVPGPIAHAARGLHAAAAVIAALAAGALLLAQQAAEVTRTVFPWTTGAVAAILAFGTGALLLVAAVRPGARLLANAALAALALYIGFTLRLFVSDSAAASAAIQDVLRLAGSGDAALGGLFGVLAHGFLRASVAGAAPGLGFTTTSTPTSTTNSTNTSANTPANTASTPAAAPVTASAPAVNLASASASTPAPVVLTATHVALATTPPASITWRATLIAGFVAVLTGLTVHATGLAARTPVTGRELVTLEQNLRTGLIPSDYGQMITIAADGPLHDGQRYPVVMRSDPRGHRLGTLFRDENIVAVAALDVLRDVDTVILRDKDPERAKNPGFDLRIAVTRELVDTPKGPYYKLAPVDPDINIRQLLIARDLDGPFLAARDYPYVASVVRGFQMAGGERFSLFEEPRPRDAKQDPAIRDFVALNYAGPYPDHGEPRPPLALVAPADSGLQPGELARLRLEPPPRGLDLGFVNRLDELEVPPWQFLAACDTAVLRHKQDPTLDIEIPVTQRLAFGRLRFTSPDVDFATLAADYPGHTGPHLRPPAHRFTAEVHSGARLPRDQADASLALVPVHMHDAPTGNPGWGVYEPHPGEVLRTGMIGPFLDEDAAGSLVRALARRWGSEQARVAALCLLVLALAGLVAWARAGRRSAQQLFGPGVAPVFAALFLACVALGPGLALAPVLKIADLAVAVAVMLAVLGLLAGIPLRRS